MVCVCEWCKRHRKMVLDGVPETIIDLVESLDSSVEYYEMILNGKWPSGKQLLENALSLYKE